MSGTGQPERGVGERGQQPPSPDGVTQRPEAALPQAGKARQGTDALCASSAAVGRTQSHVVRRNRNRDGPRSQVSRGARPSGACACALVRRGTTRGLRKGMGWMEGSEAKATCCRPGNSGQSRCLSKGCRIHQPRLSSVTGFNMAVRRQFCCRVPRWRGSVGESKRKV